MTPIVAVASRLKETKNYTVYAVPIGQLYQNLYVPTVGTMPEKIEVTVKEAE